MVTLKDFSRHKNLPQQYDSRGGSKGNIQQQPGGNQPPGPKGANLPSCSQNPGMWYCYGFGETYGQSYNGFREWGNDNDTPFHTPLYLPYGGTVTDASYHPWGGQVGINANVPGHGGLIEYVQHLDLIDPGVSVGAALQPGTYLGLSGGQIGYGYHPESPTYTSGPHTEFGFGAPWINGAQGCQPGGSCNPNSVFMFNDARAGNLNGTISGGPGTPGGGIPGGTFNLNIDPCTWPIFGWFCPGSTVNWTDILIRVLLVVSGAIMVYIGANHLFESAGMIPDTYSTEDAVSQTTKGSGNSSDKDDEDEEDEDENEEKPQPKEATAKNTAQHKAEAATQQQTQAQATERGPAPPTVRGPATA